MTLCGTVDTKSVPSSATDFQSSRAGSFGTTRPLHHRTSAGSGLYHYYRGKLESVIGTGATGACGNATFLSPGKPGLAADGSVAVRAVCTGEEVLMLVRERSAKVLLRRGQVAPRGGRETLSSFGDPWITSSGALYVGAADSASRESVYAIVPGMAPFELPLGRFADVALDPYATTAGHSVSVATLSVNERGDVAYLGGR